MSVERQTTRGTDRQTDRGTGRQQHRQTGRYRDRQAESMTVANTDRTRDTERQRLRHAGM